MASKPLLGPWGASVEPSIYDTGTACTLVTCGPAVQLFGSHLTGLANGDASVLQQFNYNTFGEAWMTTFQISSADQWMNIMWSVMQLTWVGSRAHLLRRQLPLCHASGMRMLWDC